MNKYDYGCSYLQKNSLPGCHSNPIQSHHSCIPRISSPPLLPSTPLFTAISTAFTMANDSFIPLLSDIKKPDGRIINVTHQIPYEVTLDSNGSWTFTNRRGHSAMYSGIQSLQKDWVTVHIGWTGAIYKQTLSETSVIQTVSDKDKEQLTADLLRLHGCIPLFLDSESVAGHYDGYCKTSKYAIERADCIDDAFTYHYYLSAVAIVSLSLVE